MPEPRSEKPAKPSWILSKLNVLIPMFTFLLLVGLLVLGAFIGVSRLLKMAWGLFQP